MDSGRCGSCSQHEEINRLRELTETQSSILVRFAYQRMRLRSAIDGIADNWEHAALRTSEVKVSWGYLADTLRSLTAKDRRVEEGGDVQLLPDLPPLETRSGRMPSPSGAGWLEDHFDSRLQSPEF